MSSSVKKIFITLITIVALVIVGAFLLNTLLPNVTTTLINSTGQMIYKATGLDFDFNADGTTGSMSGSTFTGDNSDTTVTGQVNSNVEGFN